MYPRLDKKKGECNGGNIGTAHRLQGHGTSRNDRDRRLVRYWLYAVFAVLIAIVMVGGATA
ncbi:putative cytochrome c oxidase assembly protein [Brucella melitensis]|nr:putative cytochrome c oxidase assembly protein [Brucella melitensis]